MHANPPVILTFSVLDPSGCGGIQADIETAASLGCHCAPIVTSVCAEGFQPGIETFSTDATIIIEQARSVLESMDVKAVKIGFLGSTSNAEAIHSILVDYDHLPVVSHPALCLLDSDNDDHEQLTEAYTQLIIPVSTVTNFSLFEARTIAQESDTIDTTAHTILSNDCELTFITGTGRETQAFQNSLYNQKGLVKHFHWEQEPPTCHGSSSTLAMSTATYMAHGFDGIQAIEHAQNYTWQTMRASRELGFSRRTPHRFYWADKNIEADKSLPAKKQVH